MRALLGNLRRWRQHRSWRQRWSASIRSSDLFLVTYPKSGTTWLNFLIANVLNQDSAPLNLRSFHQFTANINGDYFGRGSLKQYATRPAPRVFWVHAPFDPVFPQVVYLLRDPHDTLVSYWHWHRLNDRDFDLSLRDFVRSDHHWPCSWDRHVSGWVLDNQHPRLLVVRYEELQQQPAKVVSRVLDFAGIDYLPSDIQRAVEASGFDRMKALEEELVATGESLGMVQKGCRGHPEERFMRQGQVGGGKAELDSATIRFIEEKYGEVMVRLGYQLSSQTDRIWPNKKLAG